MDEYLKKKKKGQEEEGIGGREWALKRSRKVERMQERRMNMRKRG